MPLLGLFFRSDPSVPVLDRSDAVAEVAAFIRARTKSQGGKEMGTFTPQAKWEDNSGDGTRPNAEQVLALIDSFAPTFIAPWGVIPDAPAPMDPEAYRDAVARLAALGVAAEIELTYWPEQVATNRSPYQQLIDLFKTRKDDLLSVLGLDRDGDGAIDSGSGYPSYGDFPTTGITMEGAW